MSSPLLFAAGVRLQIIEADPRPIVTRVVRNRLAFHYQFSASLRVEQSGRLAAFAGLLNPRNPRLGYAIAVEPPGLWQTVIYATRADIYPLTNVVAGLLLCPLLASRTNGLVVAVTPRAQREHSHEGMNANGIPLDADLEQSPRTGDLFDECDFWSLLRSLRDSPKCETTGGVLADFVQERGFDRLAGLLRSDQRAALKILPGKSACPSRFARRVVVAV